MTEKKDVEMTSVTESEETAAPAAKVTKKKRNWLSWGLVTAGLIVGAVLTAAIAALLVSIFDHTQEAAAPYRQIVELNEQSYDPAEWGKSFPQEYEGWKKTAEQKDGDRVPYHADGDPREYTTPSNLVKDPRLVTMWKGYAFSVEYNEPRGHAYMLIDQQQTRRVTQFKQPGTCLNCHASTVEIYDKLGNGDRNAGFAAMGKIPYTEVSKLAQHPVGCIDCHDPKSMALRITRPAFVEGIKNYKASQGIKDYDVNKQATVQEMRTYVCAQCHVEYFFKGEDKTLTFPWNNGLTVQDAQKYFDDANYTDFTHKLTGAKVLKAQHPEFETYSQGVHAQSGVTCADCHMPYKRDGAQKYTDHQIKSPMWDDKQINATCLSCHHQTEQEMKDRVAKIQNRYADARNTSFNALDDLIKDLEKAVAAGGTPEETLNKARAYQRRAQYAMDYVTSENSKGFHAPQYTVSVLNQVTDDARKGQMVLKGIEFKEENPPKYPN